MMVLFPEQSLFTYRDLRVLFWGSGCFPVAVFESEKCFKAALQINLCLFYCDLDLNSLHLS